MTRRHRSLAALVAGFALAFAQFAVSAHACVPHGQPAPVEVIAHHDGCPGGMDQQQAPASDNVCAAHCQYGKATFDNTPQVPAAVDSMGPELRIELAEAAASADSRPAWRYVPAAAPPPPAILFGVLRI
jgi:hypothetical protein